MIKLKNGPRRVSGLGYKLEREKQEKPSFSMTEKSRLWPVRIQPVG